MVVPRVVNSSIVLMLGKLWRISKIRKGEKVIKNPIVAKKAIFGQFLKLVLTQTIIAEIKKRMAAK